jgi:uncharacterized damage-inducible protein DinB
MSRMRMFLCLLLVISSPLVAEHHEKEAASVYGGTLAMNFEYVSGQLMQLAEALPEATYGWRPNEEVRTTSEVVMHVVGTNMLMPVMAGVAPAEGFVMPENPFALARDLEANVTAKADVMAQLQESINYAKGALASFPEAALDEKVDMFGMEMRKRDVLLIMLSHSHEHLGQLIAYARSNGVKPPWSQPMPEAPPE